MERRARGEAAAPSGVNHVMADLAFAPRRDTHLDSGAARFPVATADRTHDRIRSKRTAHRAPRDSAPGAILRKAAVPWNPYQYMFGEVVNPSADGSHLTTLTDRSDQPTPQTDYTHTHTRRRNAMSGPTSQILLAAQMNA